MKRIAIAALLTIFVAAPVLAADDKSSNKSSIGINYGLDHNGVIAIQGEFNISNMVNKAPVSIQVFWKNYSQSYFVPGTGSYKYSYIGLGAAAIYDFSSIVKLDKKIKPYAGLGWITLSAGLTGTIPASPMVPDSGGLYIIGGVRYVVTPIFSADLSYNNYGGLTIGAIMNF